VVNLADPDGTDFPTDEAYLASTVRLENARSWASLKPTISRHPLRSGPQPTPSRSDRPLRALMYP